MEITVNDLRCFVGHRSQENINAKKSLLVGFYKTCGYYVEFLFDFFLYLFLKTVSGKCKSTRPKIIFTAQDVEWRYGGDKSKTDVFYNPLLNKLKGDYDFLGTYPLEKGLPFKGLRIYIEKLRSWNVCHRPFNLYISSESLKKEIEFLRFVRKKKMNLSKSDEYYFFVFFPHIIKYIEMAKEMIRKEKPKAIVIQNEYGVWEKSLIFAAKQENIPTVAIQHGVVYDTHPGYNFKNWNKNSIKNLLADKVCVYGNSEKDVLINNGCPEEKVVVTGHLRYDFLKDADKIFDRDKTLEKYGIDKNKKIVLWATQTHGFDNKENRLNAEMMFNFFSKMKDRYHLIIKLHPGEDQNAPLYVRFNQRFGNIATILKGKENTFELLYACDALVTKHSTVGIEAIILNKPIIITELEKSANISLYTDYGFDLVIRKEGDLEKFLELIETKKYRQEFAMLRSEFMEDRVANFGNATNEIAKVIYQIVR